MKYKAQYCSQTYLTLDLSPRKQSPYAHLFYVRDGIVLVRLGRNELMLKRGDTLYLPFDCLFQITALQGAQLDTLRVSPRLKDVQESIFPETSGKVTTSLTLPLLQALYETEQGQSRSTEQALRLIDVLLDELALCTPKPIQSPIVENNEISAQLECREIIRQVKSGKKVKSLIENRPQLEKNLKQYTDLLK